MQGSCTIICPGSIHICASGTQLTGYLQSALLACQHQGCKSICHCGVDIGAPFTKLTDNLQVAIIAS
jgi:hypothetical protein